MAKTLFSLLKKLLPVAVFLLFANRSNSQVVLSTQNSSLFVCSQMDSISIQRIVDNIKNSQAIFLSSYWHLQMPVKSDQLKRNRLYRLMPEIKPRKKANRLSSLKCPLFQHRRLVS
jgi:hypothetical protein